MRKIKWLLIVQGLILQGSFLHAQADTLSFALKKAVEITETRLQKFRQGPNFTRFSADSLGMFPAVGLSSTAVLKQAAGVYLRNYGGHGGIKTLSIRGFAAQQTQVAINGVLYQSAQTGVVNFARFFAEEYQQISLYQGASEVGLNPLGGLVDFQLAPQQTGLRLKLGSGSFGERQVMLRSDFVREQAAFLVALHFQEATDDFPYTLNGETGIREHAAFENSQYQVFGSWKLAKLGKLTYLGTGSLGTQQVPEPVLTARPPGQEGLLEEDDHFHFLKLEKLLSADQLLLPDRWEFLLNYHHNALDYFLPQQTQSYRNHDLLGQVQLEYIQPQSHLTLNLQYIQNILNGNNLAIDFRPVNQVNRGQLNLGMAYQWLKPLDSLGTRLKTETSLRFNYLQAYGLLPNASLRLQLGKPEEAELFFSASSGYRLPAFNELYYFSYGNAKLEPEQAISADLGLVKNFRWVLPVSVRLSGFFNRTHNKIISVPLNPARWSTLAVGLSQSYGLEMSTDIQFGKQTRLYYHHTLQSARDFTRPERPFLPYTPPEIINYGFNWQGKSLRFQLHGSYNSWRFALLQNGADSYLPPYHILDAGVGYLFKGKKVSYYFLGEVENLTNRSYAIIRSYPMPPRMFRLSVVLKY